MRAFPTLGPFEVLEADALYLLAIVNATLDRATASSRADETDRRTVNPDGSISVEINSMAGLRGFLRGKR
jgi:hypothetical protein